MVRSSKSKSLKHRDDQGVSKESKKAQTQKKGVNAKIIGVIISAVLNVGLIIALVVAFVVICNQGDRIEELGQHLYREDEIIETEPVKFEEQFEDDASLDDGTTQVKQEGSDGEKTLVYKVVFDGNEEKSKELISEEITTQPTQKITLRGTKKAAATSRPSQTATPSNTNSSGNSTPVSSPQTPHYTAAQALAQCKVAAKSKWGSNAYFPDDATVTEVATNHYVLTTRVKPGPYGNPYFTVSAKCEVKNNTVVSFGY